MFFFTSFCGREMSNGLTLTDLIIRAGGVGGVRKKRRREEKKERGPLLLFLTLRPPPLPPLATVTQASVGAIL